MSIKSGIVVGAAFAGVMAAGVSMLKSGDPDGCFRAIADGKLYTVDNGKDEIAHNSWREAEDKQSCFRSDGGGNFTTIPVIEFP